jgi:hypothetical protein
MEKETQHRREDLLKWTVYAFQYNLRYLSNQAATLKRYAEITKPK